MLLGFQVLLPQHGLHHKVQHLAILTFHRQLESITHPLSAVEQLHFFQYFGLTKRPVRVYVLYQLHDLVIQPLLQNMQSNTQYLNQRLRHACQAADNPSTAQGTSRACEELIWWH
uniref:Uncharacterized protein n=1 Tax=Opuntia streptacantha TaxID=393608 RepID=A0A7C8Z6N1_OPUST